MKHLRQWRHIFKLDPEKSISDSALERICTSGTDAIMVGGSSGVTFNNTVELLSRIRTHPVFWLMAAILPEWSAVRFMQPLNR